MPKKPLDTNKPRGPVTAYALFVRTCRDELRRKYPQLTVDYNVIVKKCSERWKAMSENEKKRFNDTADLQRKRYKEELATYQQEQQARQLQQQQQQSATSSILLQTPATQFLVEPSHAQHALIMPAGNVQHSATTALVTVPKKPARKRERKPKDPLAPKKPLSAYFLFCADERPKVHGSQTDEHAAADDEISFIIDEKDPLTMFVAASNSTTPSTYIVAAATAAATANVTPTPPVTNGGMETATATGTPALSDIKLICTRRKKKTKRHIYVTFVESRPIASPSEQPCIELIGKSNGSSPSSSLSYLLSDCLSFEYFDTVKNDFQSFIYAYFESYTISIYFSDEQLDKKSVIIKHLENMTRSKSESTSEINNNTTNSPGQDPLPTPVQPAGQPSNLPCSPTTEQILHSFDVHLTPHGTIISRDHMLIGPARLYFTTTDLYITTINCSRTDLKITITNQCPTKEKAILCIPYFTIKNYGNRSNIFLIELGKSTYGNGEIHMKCQSSSLASTIHLLVSPVIEERPLILSSAFQNQLLTNKRMEKSKNIQPPIQLSNETNNGSIFDASVSFLKRKPSETTLTDGQPAPARSTDIRPRVLVGFFRSLTKNVAHLRRSATFHNNSSCNNQQIASTDPNAVLKTKTVAFSIDEKMPPNDQHQILLPESQKKSDSTSIVSSVLTKKAAETIVASSSTLDTLRPINTMGTYIDMGPTVPKANQQQEEQAEVETIVQETATTVDVGVNTMISLSPQVRSAIIVGNTVHLIADEKTVFHIGQRSFTSPASVMQPFKTQLNGTSAISPYAPSTDAIGSSPNSSNSLHQATSASNSQQSLLLSYGIVTFNSNDSNANDQNERAISPPADGSMLDHRLNSDLSVLSISQQQSSQQPLPNVYPLDSVLSASNAHIFRTLSVSTMNTGDNLSGPLRTPHGSIVFFDEHLNDQTTTYLLGPPPTSNDESLPSTLPRLSSFNLSSSISRSHLSHIDEEKTSSQDPYALVEPLPDGNSISTSSSGIVAKTPVLAQKSSLNYADLQIPTLEQTESNETPSNNPSDDQSEGSNETQEDEQISNQRPSTILYTDIDFLQTQRRDRIAQFAAKAKLDDQTPPFVL